MGLVTGPLSATLLRRMESSSSCGSVLARFLDGELACKMTFPFDRDARRFQNANDSFGDFRTDASPGMRVMSRIILARTTRARSARARC